MGDSFSASFGNAWQNVVIARTGMVLATQDAIAGRTYEQALQCWGNPAVGQPIGVFDSTYGLCSYFTTGFTNGETLAQSLANTDILVIELGANNSGTTIGELGDPTNAGTYFGTMRWVVETYQAAKPSLRIVMVTPQWSTFGNAADIQAHVNAEVVYGNSMGIPVINMYVLGGVNALSAPALLQSDVLHPSAFGFANNYGPVIANALTALY